MSFVSSREAQPLKGHETAFLRKPLEGLKQEKEMACYSKVPHCGPRKSVVRAPSVIFLSRAWSLPLYFYHFDQFLSSFLSQLVQVLKLSHSLLS